jgi:hypothetical protein
MPPAIVVEKKHRNWSAFGFEVSQSPFYQQVAKKTHRKQNYSFGKLNLNIRTTFVSLSRPEVAPH